MFVSNEAERNPIVVILNGNLFGNVLVADNLYGYNGTVVVKYLIYDSKFPFQFLMSRNNTYYNMLSMYFKCTA